MSPNRPSPKTLLLGLSLLACSGIAQRTVQEQSAGGSGDTGGGGAGGGALAQGGRAGSMLADAGQAAMAGGAGTPVDCEDAPNFHGASWLSAWEYQRSVVALTGTPVTTSFPPDVAMPPPFAFSIGPGAADAMLAEAEKQGIAARGGNWLPCGNATCVGAFVDDFVGRAFRRPLTEAERVRYENLFKQGSVPGLEGGVQVLVTATLLSPLFWHKLYLGDGSGAIPTPLTSFEVGARLSFFLTGGPPDAALLQAAAGGYLDTEEGIDSELQRLSSTPGFYQAAQHLHAQWFGYDQLDVAQPNLPAELRASMRSATDLFVQSIFEGERSLPALLTATSGFIDSELAPRYGSNVPVGDGFIAFELDHGGGHFAGLLTQPATVAALTNPSQRGKLVRERLLCGVLPPDPPGVDRNVVVSPGQTRRQAWLQHQQDPACAGCHQQLDPIGFGFEAFDETGLYRTVDAGSPVDTSGEVVDALELDGPFANLHELSDRLGQSPRVAACVTRAWLSYALQRPLVEGEECEVQRLATAFQAGHYDFLELIKAIAKSPRFRTRDAFMAPSGGPMPMPSTGNAQTDQQRRQLVLDFALSEAEWLSRRVPDDERMMVEQYLTMLRDLQLKASSF